MKLTALYPPGFKSHCAGLLLRKENGKCSTAKYCAEFPNIGNHSLKRKWTVSGLSMMRHSVNKWKLEQVMITGVITVEMVTNAFLCDRGRSDNVLPVAEFKPYMFLGQCIQLKGQKVAEDITFRESQSDALSDVGRTHSSNESQTNDKPNLCCKVWRATVRG